jgi:hypothetical protein
MKTRHILTALLGTCLMTASLSSFAAEITFNLTPEGKANVKNTPSTQVTEDCGIVYMGSQKWGYFTRTTTQLNMDSIHQVEEINLYSNMAFHITLQGTSNMFNHWNRGQVSATNISAFDGAMYKWTTAKDPNSITITY